MRSDNFFKNVSMGIVSRLLNQLLGFVVRTVFIYSLSKEFLGINGLFSSVFAFLNLTELGLGSAIVFALYKPLAQGDREKIRELMKFYRQAYWVIGSIIGILGIALIPFLPSLVKDENTLINVNIIYIIYLAETVISYWFWAYKSSMFIADQKEYIASVIKNIVDIFKSLFRIIFLLLLQKYPVISFYVYSILGIAFILISNYLIGKKADILYPFLLEEPEERLPILERNNIFKNVIGLSAYRISGTVNNAVDTLLISAVIGLVANGIYSNYELLVSIINGMIWIVVTALVPGIGNLNTTESDEKKYFSFHCVALLMFWIYGFCGISLWVLLNPFIGSIWLDETYLLSDTTVMLIFLNFITGGMLTVFSIFIEATGNFSKRGLLSIASAGINLLLSIVFLLYTDLGISGVILATIIARMITIVPFYPNIVAKEVFKKKSRHFFCIYFRLLSVSIITGGIIYFFTFFMPGNLPVKFLFQILICIIGTNSIWYLMFRKTKEFNYIKNVLLTIIKKFIRSGQQNGKPKSY